MGLRPLAAAALAAALGAGPAAGQSADRARYVVDLTADDGSAAVRVDYRVAPSGEDRIPLRLLGVGAAHADSARVDGRWGVSLEPSSGSLREAAVPADSAADGTLRLEYRVPAAVSVDGHSVRAVVPLLTVGWPPAEADPDVFAVTVRMPGAWAVADGFPTGLREVATSEAWREYESRLSVVPSMVTLRARTDGAFRPGLPLWLDGLTLVVVVGFGLFGWRHLSRVAEAAADVAEEGAR